MTFMVKHLDLRVQDRQHFAGYSTAITMALATIPFGVAITIATVMLHLYCCSLKYFKFTVGFKFSYLYHFLNFKMMFVAVKLIDFKFMNKCSITASIDLVAQILLCRLKVWELA